MIWLTIALAGWLVLIIGKKGIEDEKKERDTERSILDKHDEDKNEWLAKKLGIEWHELEWRDQNCEILDCSCGKQFAYEGDAMTHVENRNPHFDTEDGCRELAKIMSQRPDWPKFATYIGVSGNVLPKEYAERPRRLMYDVILFFLES